MLTDVLSLLVGRTNRHPLTLTRTNGPADERTTTFFVDRDCQPLLWLGRCGVPCRRPKQSAASAWSCGDDDQGKRRNWQGAEREEKMKEEPLSQLGEKGGQSEQQLRRRSSSFFCKGREEYQGEKKERKEKKSGRRGGRKTTGLENNFIISHYSLSLPSQELSGLLVCLDQVRVLEFGNRVVVDLGFQRHSPLLFYFWGESLSLSLSLSLLMDRCCQLLLSPLVSFSLSVFRVLGFLFNFSSSVYFCFFHVDCMLLLDFEMLVHRFAMSWLVLTFFLSRVITYMVRGAFLVDRSCFFRGSQMSIWISGFLPADL